MSPVTVLDMHRMLCHLRTRRRSSRRADAEAVVLVHASGVVLAAMDGTPLAFPSAAEARLFAMRHTCEPLGFRVVPAAPRPAPLEPAAA